MTRRRRREGESRKNTRPRDYAGDALFIWERKNLRRRERECGGGKAAYNKRGAI